MARVVLLGLDGATFTLLDPLLQEHRLPNLARLMQEGVRGPLRSTIHPLTPAAWTSAVTGVNPGKHGIYDFRRRRPGSYALDLVNARLRDAEPLWTLLSKQGRRVGVFNVPMTYPPDAVNGFVVSGMDAPGVESSFISPASLRPLLLAAVPDYQIDLDEGTEDEEVYLSRVEALAEVQQQALDTLLSRHPDLDFLMAVFVATDRLYHAFWHYLDPASPAYDHEHAAVARSVHERLLCRIDDTIGRLQTWAGDDATFLVISDHGFGPLEKDVYMNRFLLDIGLLRFRSQPGYDSVPFAEAVDWQSTRAYSFGFFGNIYLNLRGREPQGCVEQGREAEALMQQIIAALQDLRDPETGTRMVDNVYRREQLYSGPHVGEAPDLLVVMRDYAYMTRDGYEGVHGNLVGKPMSLSRHRLVHTGNHRLDGIMIMAGPGIRAGGYITDATLTDIAPTVLYALGVPIPNIMDGRVLRQAFSDEHLAAHPVRHLAGPLPPLQSPAQRQLAEMSQRVAALESRVKQLEESNQQAAARIRELEAVIADRNKQIEGVVQMLHYREEMLDRYQRTIFFRAYQRWQRLRGRVLTDKE